MMDLAELEAAAGNDDIALRLADFVAHRSAGSIARAERLRVKLHQKKKDPPTPAPRRSQEPLHGRRTRGPLGPSVFSR